MAKQQYVVHDLKYQSKGAVAEITLRGTANIRLMDSSNLRKFKSDRSFQCEGGLAKKSPVILTIPRAGHWYVVVDTLGLRGSVKSSARILPGAMKPIRQDTKPQLSGLLRDSPVRREGPRATHQSKDLRTYDVFISHASEDKDDIARPLAEALQERRLNVWFDELRLKIGDSLREQIAKGINSSRFAVVILSESFVSKGWTKHEIRGMMTRSIDGQQVILPIWHKFSRQQVIDFDPGLADTVALNTAVSTVEEIADEIADVILGTDSELQEVMADPE